MTIASLGNSSNSYNKTDFKLNKNKEKINIDIIQKAKTRRTLYLGFHGEHTQFNDTDLSPVRLR